MDRPGSLRGEKGERRGESQRGLSIPTPLEVISGRNAVREALRAGRRVRRLLLMRGGRRDELVENAVRLARERQISVQEVDEEELLFLGAEHQGMAAIVSPFPYVGWGDFLEGLKGADHPPAVLLLDTLQDPQNLGTLMRTAEALRIDGVVLPKRRSVQVTPAVVRSSSGAVEHMVVAQVPNLVRAVQDLKRVGLWVAGLDVAGDRFPWDLDMTGPTALLLGGEDHGIGQLLKEQCDFMVRLPMVGEVNSLNAAVAGSVVLYEMARQRGKS